MKKSFYKFCVINPLPGILCKNPRINNLAKPPRKQVTLRLRLICASLNPALPTRLAWGHPSPYLCSQIFQLFRATFFAGATFPNKRPEQLLLFL
jgi:hypothetical protein